LALNEKALWYEYAGLTLNVKKSELLTFGFVAAPISINGDHIHPSPSIKFLGLHLQQNLKWDIQVSELCNKIRWAASRIRSEGQFFCLSDRILLYNAWISSLVHCNALAFLPNLTDGQLNDLQTAMNSGIRALYKLPKRDSTSITSIRTQLNILSVRNILEKCLLVGAFKNRNAFLDNENNNDGPLTRARLRGDVLHPIQKGHLGKLSSCHIAAAWNRLPLDIRQTNVIGTGVRAIKKYVCK